MEGLVAVPTGDLLTRYDGTRILVTGHSGFKGTWLCTWLADLGAEVFGFSLPAEGDNTNIAASTDLRTSITEISGDVRDPEMVRGAFKVAQPQIVFHMAAQALVRPSYEDPVGTISTNVMGAVNVFEAVQHSSSVQAVVAIASDKCYENLDDGHPYAETDSLGGSDPYSASKGAAEVITRSYGRSFFNDPQGPLLASVRAGNVLGAGDASRDRLIPDIIRTIKAGGIIEIRNPSAVRPWQHVLEPLRAYLMLGSYLLAGDRSKTGSWNIGPNPDGAVTVAQLVRMVVDTWDLDLEIRISDDAGPPETEFLRLDTTKATRQLGFAPYLGIKDTVDFVVDGYGAQLGGDPLLSVIRRQIASYLEMS